MTKNALAFKKPPLLNESSHLDFGQYKSQTLGEVMKFDAAYLLWLIEKKLIDVEPWLCDDINELAQEQEFTGYELGYDEIFN